MSHFMSVGIFRIGLKRTDLGSWRLTLTDRRWFRETIFPIYRKWNTIEKTKILEKRQAIGVILH